jgi:sec-independent protein translocase protein TatA
LTDPLPGGTLEDHEGGIERSQAMFGLGATELLIILGICVLLFGARRLPEIGSGLGKAIKGFRAGISGKDEIDVTPTQEELPKGEDSPDPGETTR